MLNVLLSRADKNVLQCEELSRMCCTATHWTAQKRTLLHCVVLYWKETIT